MKIALPATVIVCALILTFEVPAKPVPKATEKTTIKCASFLEKQFNSDDFQLFGKNTDQYVRKEKEGLRITLPAQNGPATPVGIVLKHLVRGDFEFEAVIETIDVPAPGGPLTSGMQIYLKIDSPPRPGMYFGKMHDPVQGPIYLSGIIADRPTGRTGIFEKKVATKPAAGEARIRLVRRGSKIEFSGCEAGARNFTPVGHLDVNEDDISFFRLAAEPGERPDSRVDVRILSCSIQAREFVSIVPELKK